MLFAPAHLSISPSRRPSSARAGLVLGALVALAGLDIPTRGGFDAPAEARTRLTQGWTGRTVAVALLATRPDRWGRWLAGLALPGGPHRSTGLLNGRLGRVPPEI